MYYYCFVGGVDALLPHNEEIDHIRTQEEERYFILYLGEQVPLMANFRTSTSINICACASL